MAGVADAVRAAGFAFFGPSAAAARLEGSKAFAKEVMAAAGGPHRHGPRLHPTEQVAAALDAFGAPHVVKDDGLAAGKGVVVTDDREAALAHARACLAHGPVVVEEFLDGPEVTSSASPTARPSCPAARAGLQARPRRRRGPQHRRHGRLLPADWVPATSPTSSSSGSRSRRSRRWPPGTPFSGVLYGGLALTSRGLRVIEFNARFGDPEGQVVPRPARHPARRGAAGRATGRLDQPAPRWRPRGRRHRRRRGPRLPRGPRDRRPAARPRGRRGGLAAVLHAGTTRDADGRLVCSGGRVVDVVATGADLGSARAAAYARSASSSSRDRTTAPTSRWPHSAERSATP